MEQDQPNKKFKSEMKNIQFLLSVLLIMTLIFLQSCGDEEEPNEESCVDQVLGTWEVTSFIPFSADCGGLSRYEIATGSADNILSFSIVDGSRTLSGSGLINTSCTQMTYTVSQGQTIVSGTILFNGTMFEDQSDLGCLVSARKQ